MPGRARSSRRPPGGRTSRRNRARRGEDERRRVPRRRLAEARRTLWTFIQPDRRRQCSSQPPASLETTNETLGRRPSGGRRGIVPARLRPLVAANAFQNGARVLGIRRGTLSRLTLKPPSSPRPVEQVEDHRWSSGRARVAVGRDPARGPAHQENRWEAGPAHAKFCSSPRPQRITRPAPARVCLARAGGRAVLQPLKAASRQYTGSSIWNGPQRWLTRSGTSPRGPSGWP